MRYVLLTLALLMAGTGLLVTPAVAEEWTAEQFEVIGAIEAYEDAWNTRDAEAMAA